MAKGKAAEIRIAYNSNGHAETFRSEVESVLTTAFNERWAGREDSGLMVPLLAEVKEIEIKFSMMRPGGISKYRVDMQILYVVDYHGVYATRCHEIQLELDADEPADILAGRIRENEPDILKTVREGVSRLPDVYPENLTPQSVPAQPFSKVSFLLGRKDYRRKEEICFHELFNQIFCDKDIIGPVVHEALLHARKTVDISLELPQNAIPIEGVGLAIRHHQFSNFSDTIQARYNLKFKEDNHDYVILQEISLPDFFPVFRKKNAGAKEEIAAAIQEKIISTFDSEIGRLPPYYLNIPDLQLAADAFHSGGIKIGNIRAACGPTIPPGVKITFLPGDWGMVGVDLWRKDGVERKENLFSLKEVEQKLLAPVQMDSKAGFPESPISFIRFCKEASALYEQFAAERKLEMPELSFFYKKGKGYTCRCRGKDMQFPANIGSEEMYAKTVRERLYDLFEAIAKPEDVPQEEVDRQAEVLSTLNHTELLILKKVVEPGKSWRSKIARDIEAEALTLKSEIDPSIERLCNTHIFQDGERLPLLSYTIAKSSNRSYKLYFSPVSWSISALQNAVPCPFPLKKFQFLTKAGKEKFLADAVKTNRCEEDNVIVLRALELSTAKMVVSFAKTAQGEEFFRGIEGEAAVRAKALLESLPSCKRLVSKYFPEN